MKGIAALTAVIIVASGSVMTVGEIIGGHVVRGIGLGAMVMVFMWQWVQLRTGSGRVSPDELAFTVSAIVAFGLGLPQLEAVISWFRG